MTSDDHSLLYTKEFYEYKKGWTHRSADAVSSTLLELIKPQSVVDVGCGTGTWLAAFKNHGVNDLLGIDGDYVETPMLEIPHEQFMPFDLSTPLQLERTFDLAISLEVAEHLDECCANAFVTTLTELAPIVLFSAAITHQGGVNHVNEQWQDYWQQKFEAKGYVAIDHIKKAAWNNINVAAHYPQNILLYVSQEQLQSSPKLEQAADQTNSAMIKVVHPLRYLRMVEKNTHLEQTTRNLKEQIQHMQDPDYMSLQSTLKLLPKLVVNAITNRISGK